MEILISWKLVARIAGNLIQKKMRQRIIEVADFDIEKLTPLEHIEKIKCPLVFVHGKSDSLVPIKHSKALFEVILFVAGYCINDL